MLVGALSFLAFGAASADEPIARNPLIEIPAGPFVFGNDTGNANERPSKAVNGAAFAMNQTEISNAQYQAFIDATGHRSAFYGGHHQLGVDDRPAVGVSWGDADAFCRHYGLRLPTEQQFERAARGVDGASWPWGRAATNPMRVNAGAETCCSGDKSDGYEMTAAVDAFPDGASAEGILNLVGNVWEWTDDMYVPYEAKADPAVAGQFRVLRGGAWNSDPVHLTTTYRLAYNPNYRFAANGGFRCVRSGQQSSLLVSPR